MHPRALTTPILLLAVLALPALGGTPRRVTTSLSEGDVSHDGRRIATFQARDGKSVLAILQRDGSAIQTKPLPPLVRPVAEGLESVVWTGPERSLSASRGSARAVNVPSAFTASRTCSAVETPSSIETMSFLSRGLESS